MSLVIGSCSELGISSVDVCDFYKKNWPRSIALSDVNFYKWQFINNPQKMGADDCCVAIDGDNLIGVMGLNTRDFYINGKMKIGAELTTWVVSQDMRNKGAGPGMITYLKENYAIMVGMGISQAALPIYLRNGFRYIKSIPRYVLPINWGNLNGFIDVAPLAKKYNKEQLLLTDFNVSKTSVSVIDEIFERFIDSHNCFSRKYSDIQWRYDAHPYYRYEHFIINGDCFVCIRIDKDIDGFIMAHCVDIFGNKDSYQSAISAAIAFARQNDADAIDFFATNSSLCAILNYMGLFSTLDHDFLKFPHLFHPVEIREPATTSLILWAKDNLESILDFGKLHITKQDADFDRPTGQVLIK